jgi:hypothetical protein
MYTISENTESANHLPLLGKDNVGTSGNAKFVDGVTPVPNTTLSLHYGDDLLSNALCKTALATADVPSL